MMQPLLATRIPMFVFILLSVLAQIAEAACPTPPIATLTCSSEVQGTLNGNTPSTLDGLYTCGQPWSPLWQTNPEDIYEFSCQAVGNINILLTDLDCDLDIYVLDDTCQEDSGCLSGSTIENSTDDQVMFTCIPGEVYYIVIEAYGAQVGPAYAGHCGPGDGNYTLDFDTSNPGVGGCVEDCDDLIDNDLDGPIDCADSDCWNDPACIEICDDGIDNDHDSDIDCEDLDCWGDPACIEICDDGIDNDLDSYIDCLDDECWGYPTCCDDDQDGFIDALGTCGGDDCHDRDPTVFPGQSEFPDGVDDDCNGLVDDTTPWYDDDGDGYAEIAGDCHDGDPNVHPFAVEICDGVDQNCNDVLDEQTDCYDDDGDGWTEDDGDCNDTVAIINPGVVDVANNGIDDDCDGIVDDYVGDLDGDGWLEEAGDCNPNDAKVYPGAPETPDGVDNDCDGIIDEGTVFYDDDGDGYSETQGDCNDETIDIGPEMEEIVNGIDDDCDGQLDEGTERTDDDGDGWAEVGGDCDDSDVDVHPDAIEIADNGIDDDCDGVVDEFVDLDGDGFSIDWGDCDDTTGWRSPEMIEMCDEVDNNCDGIVDENCEDLSNLMEESECGCASSGAASGLVWMIGLLITARRRR